MPSTHVLERGGKAEEMHEHEVHVQGSAVSTGVYDRMWCVSRTICPACIDKPGK